MPAAVRKWHAEVALLLLKFCSWKAQSELHMRLLADVLWQY